ncbi:MAG: TAT-variant-translocated molybdopterin oxidoreductase [Verrucomicrobia bacterium]|nr:TAT-variant-translocated molybdopterin oxidoreductase [Verrucomicrobiota bacterium]
MSKTIPPACPEPESGPTYWRSLEQLAGTPEFREWAEREFPEGASELRDDWHRRDFMKLMSASFLLAGLGLTGCRRPVETIHPFAKQPEGYIHGVSKYFATAMPARSSAIPLLVKSHEGRPIKIEGNPEHPLNAALTDEAGHKHGGTNLFAQASILNLYDPDRARRFLFKGQNSSRARACDALAELAKKFTDAQGKGMCVLMERSSSPSRARLQQALTAKFPQARWFIYEPMDGALAGQAAAQAFGQAVRPLYRLDKARRILALDADFMAADDDSYLLIRGFAKGRRLRSADDDMNRLYVVESLMTVTGANADHRLRLPSSQVAPLAMFLTAQMIEAGGQKDTTPGAAEFVSALLEKSKGLPEVARTWAAACAEDLMANAGSVVVLAGERQPLEVHLLAHAMNFYLGRQAGAVSYVADVTPPAGTIVELATALNAGEVETLVMLGGNPAYNAPADLDWPAAQRKAGTVIRLGYFEDETAPQCDWHLPLAHYLESWGDLRTADGTLVPVQPLIEPLFGGLTELEVLARLGGLPVTRPYDIARETFKLAVGDAEFEEKWKRYLHDGFLAGTAAPAVQVEIDWPAITPAVLGLAVPEVPTAQRLEVAFARAYSVDDGRYANNGWLQELPDPVSKITWDNVIALSQKTAQELGVVVVDRNRMDLSVPVLRIAVGNRTIEGPAWIQPGMADGVVGVTLGYGRPRAGRIGRGVGYDAYPIRTSTGMGFASGARLEITNRKFPLSCTQNHWTMQGRPVIREANLEEFRKDPGFANAMNLHEPPGPRGPDGQPKPAYPNPLDTAKLEATHWWGMSVDLNGCVGCSACVIACQSENNIPIVGKEQVNRGREMHWMRIDRYFAGSVAEPQVVNQPMLCQHCEAAPCESVCPVNATVHDNEGLNVMAYNRCVGTRYCSNNCPYKVRRFNFFDYNRRPITELYKSPLVSFTDGEWELKRWFKDRDRGSRPQDEWDLVKLAKNPDVTVRMRGVMEKCTFCLQRIEGAKIAQKIKAGASADVAVPDGTFKTACQQACPADAIVFGNLRDETSRVSKATASQRTYKVLEFLQTKPRVTYQARVRNPNPKMPDYHAQPLTTREYLDAGGTLGHHGDGHAAGYGHDAKGETKGAH